MVIVYVVCAYKWLGGLLTHMHDFGHMCAEGVYHMSPTDDESGFSVKSNNTSSSQYYIFNVL